MSKILPKTKSSAKYSTSKKAILEQGTKNQPSINKWLNTVSQQQKEGAPQQNSKYKNIESNLNLSKGVNLNVTGARRNFPKTNFNSKISQYAETCDSNELSVKRKREASTIENPPNKKCHIENQRDRIPDDASPLRDTLGTSPGQLTTTKVSDSGKSLAVEKVLGQSHHLLAKNRTKHVLKLNFRQQNYSDCHQ